MPARATSYSDPSRLDTAISRAQEFLLDAQYPGGYWWGELESNPTMEAEYLLLTHFLGTADPERWRKLANHILRKQNDDGAWGQFYGAPGDLSTSTECYFALKLAGVSPDAPQMRKARDFILSGGGVANTRVFTKIWLSLFGQWEWEGVPSMPAEMMLLPSWFPISIYDFSSWARATIVPMFILMDRKPIRPAPGSACLDELYPGGRAAADYSVKQPSRLIGWETFFYAGDKILKQLDRLPWKPTRGQAIRKAEEWIVSHQEADGSWGGIQPPWVYSLMALHTLGYSTRHPVIERGLAGLENFIIEEDDTMRVQACVSPVWDTPLTIAALLDSGLPPDHPALIRAGQWLLKEQVLEGGDWQVKAKSVPPGGWAFEFHNDLYPDLDDTAEIVIALQRLSLSSHKEKRDAIDRGIAWVLGMQSSNGGWAAFDKDNTKFLVSKIPFADFGETLDPPSVDVTAHVLEMLAHAGYGMGHPAVDRAVEYVLSEQEADGPWFGRWGVNYIYGTAAVLPALATLGFDMSTELVRRAVDWIIEHQNPDGGWGESCSSYADPSLRGTGPSTASQTAWGLLSLLAAGQGCHEAALRGIDYLLMTQQADGSWDEPYFTGTGFPGYGVGQRPERYPMPDDQGRQGAGLPNGFMINYHMYRNYWPLTALGRYRRLLRGERVIGVGASEYAGIT